jgi:L-rhamnose isomerase
MMMAYLEPTELLLNADRENNAFEQLALLEEQKSLPFGSVWNYYCKQEGVLIEREMIKDISDYERNVLLKR